MDGPEQVCRQSASPGMDLFALGAVLFELATGDQAFDTGDHGPPERRWPQLVGPPLLASGRNPEVPAALDRAVAALLAPDPADRPATAAQALGVLAAAMPADAAEEDRLWPTWATGRLDTWQASAMARSPAGSTTCVAIAGGREMLLVRLVATGKTALAPGAIPERALVGARGGRWAGARSPDAGPPRGH